VSGNVEACAVLAMARADMNLKSLEGFSPLHMAVGGHAEEGRLLEICRVLQDAGADPRQVDGAGNNVLHLAVSAGPHGLELCRYLLHECWDYCGGHGGLLESKNIIGQSPLHVAASIGNAPAVKLLLSLGADINSTSALNESPLHVAVQFGHPDICEILLQNPQFRQLEAGACRWLPLHLAAHEDNPDLVFKILKRPYQGLESLSELDALTEGQATSLMIASVRDASDFRDSPEESKNNPDPTGLVDCCTILAGFGAAKPPDYSCRSMRLGPNGDFFRAELIQLYVPSIASNEGVIVRSGAASGGQSSYEPSTTIEQRTRSHRTQTLSELVSMAPWQTGSETENSHTALHRMRSGTLNGR